jgi:hypothetical protein
MAESKKAWVTPELIVLVRSKPEEVVLDTCKYLAPSVGPNTVADRCTDPCPVTCANLVQS